MSKVGTNLIHLLYNVNIYLKIFFLWAEGGKVNRKN